MWWRSVCYFILVSIVIQALIVTALLTASTEVTIQVRYRSDDVTASANYCIPTSTELCNLRSAWKACNSFLTTDVHCVIEVPKDYLIYLNSGLGPLPLLGTSNIQLKGNNSIIYQQTPSTDGVVETDLTDTSTIDYRFIVYTQSDPKAIPSLTIQEAQIYYFGSNQNDGGAFYFYGSVNININSAFIYSSKASNGGGIYVQGNTAGVTRLHNVQISSSSVVNSGGGIFVQGSHNVDLTLVSTISCQAGGFGGGYYILQVESTRLASTSASECSAEASGGGYVLALATGINMTDATATACQCNSNGAGFYFESMIDFHVTNLAASDCSAQKSGGGVMIYSGENIFLSNVNATRCMTQIDGGGFAIDSATSVKFSKTNAISCESQSGGGGYSVSSSHLIEFDSSFASSCSAVNSGGGGFAISSTSYFSLSNSQVQNCLSFFGGGLYLLDSSNIDFFNTILSSNIATYGGGSFLQNVTTLNLTLVKANECQAKAIGGGFYFSGVSVVELQSVEANNCFVANNDSTETIGAGGGFIFLGSSLLTLNRVSANRCYIRAYPWQTDVKTYGGGFTFLSTIKIQLFSIIANGCYVQNDAAGDTTTYGGGMILLSGIEIVIENIQVLGCYAHGKNLKNVFGGGLLLFGANTKITSLQAYNCSTNGAGGGLFMIGNTNLKMSMFSISYCTASLQGGGMAILASKGLKLSSGSVTDCSASTDGGGIYARTSSTILLTQMNIQNCTAQGRGGGMCNERSTNMSYISNNFTSNSAEFGGGLFADTATYTNMIGNAITHNRATDGAGLYLDTFNLGLVCVDSTTFASRQIVETEHEYYFDSPYTTDDDFYNDADGMVEAMNKTISNPDASGWLIVYDVRTNISAASNEFFDGNGLLVYKTVSSCDNFTSLVVCETATYPGISAPILYIAGDSFTFQLNVDRLINGYCDSYCYGIKFYAYPILRSNGNSQYNIIENNVANRDGGGLQLVYNNQFALLMNFLISYNKAGSNGGGMYLVNANSGSYLYNVTMRSNECGNLGGGMTIYVAHHGIQLRDIKLIENKASNAGGGMYISTGNGDDYGPYLSQSNLINFTSIVVSDNYADEGGGMFIDNGNSLSFSDKVVSNNRATAGGGLYFWSVNRIITEFAYITNNTALDGGGGGVFVGNKNNITYHNVNISSNAVTSENGGGIYSKAGNIILVNNCLIQSNHAGAAGGGLYCTDLSELYLQNNTMYNNSAKYVGGGLYIDVYCNVTFTGHNSFDHNDALQGGGGIALNFADLWTINQTATTTSTVYITNNTARRGSALFFNNLMAESNLTNLVIDQNHATIGGTVFWFNNFFMTSPPPGLHGGKGIEWGDNYAPYGTIATTQGIKLIVPEVYDVTVYQQYLNPPVSVYMLDYYGVKIPLNGSTTVDVTLNADAGIECKGYSSSLLESNMIQQGLPFKNGNAVFSELQAFCAPGGNFTVTFTANLGSLDSLPPEVNYDITNQTKLHFRQCKQGEYLSTKGECIECANGKYSLSSGAATCKTCFGVEGIAECYGNQIVLVEGYWRRYASNEAVLICPLKSACVGGNLTGEVSCALGYGGSLCAVCSDGYYMDSGECVACGNDGLFNPVLIVILTMASLVSVAIIAFIIIHFVFMKEVPENQAMLHTSAVNNQVGDIETMNNPMKPSTIRPSVSDAHLRPPTYVFGYELNTNNEMLIDVLSNIEFYYHYAKAQYAKITAQIKVVMSTYQISMAMSSVLSITLPRFFSKFVNSLSFVNLNISSIFPIGCAGTLTFIDQLVITTLAPIVLLLLLFVVEYSYERFRIQQNKERKKGDKRRAFERIKDNYMSYWFYISYLVLPSVSTMIFQIFLCTNVDPNHEDSDSNDHYLIADMRISCTSNYFYGGVLYAILMIFVYPIGIPMSYFLLLYYNRDEIRDRKKNNAIVPPPQYLQKLANLENESRSSNVSSKEMVDIKSAVNEVDSHDVKIVHNPINLSTLEQKEEEEEKEEGDDDDGDGLPLKANSNLDENISTTLQLQAPFDESTSKEETIVVEKEAEAEPPKQQQYLSIKTARIAFLWQAYQPQYWYWEIVETTRRLMLTAVLSVCGPGTFDQAVFSVFLSIFYIKLYGYFSPYDNGNNNVLAEVGQFQNFFTFFGGLIIQTGLLSNDFSTALDIFLFITNLAIMVTIGYFLNLNAQRTLKNSNAKLNFNFRNWLPTWRQSPPKKVQEDDEFESIELADIHANKVK